MTEQEQREREDFIARIRHMNDEADKFQAEMRRLTTQALLDQAQARWEPFKSVGLMAIAFFAALGAAKAFGWL